MNQSITETFIVRNMTKNTLEKNLKYYKHITVNIMTKKLKLTATTKGEALEIKTNAQRENNRNFIKLKNLVENCNYFTFSTFIRSKSEEVF